MPRISQMPPPSIQLSGLELIPALQGGGADSNVGLPLLCSGPPYGGNVLALRLPMAADMISTSDGDPGAGKVRWNHVTPESATEIYVSDDDGDSGDLEAVLAALDAGGYLYLQGGLDSEARNNWQRWQVTSVTPESGYSTLAVSLQSSGGTFADEDVLELTVQQPLPSPGIDRNVVTTATSSSGTTALDASLGDYFKVALTENTTIALINVPNACTLHLQLIQHASAGPYTVNFPGTWDWGDGNDPPDMVTGAGKSLDVIVTTNDAGASAIATARARA